VVEVPVVLVALLVDGGVCEVVEAAFWSVVEVAAVPVVLLAGGFCVEVADGSVLVAVPAAEVEPLPTVLDGVWLLTGGCVAVG
jgi:hypothetical protein